MTTAQRISYFNLALCILFWASIPVVSKKILVEMTNVQMLFWSTIFSFVVLAGLLVAQGKVRLLSRYSLRAYGWMALLGFLGAYLYYILLYGALARTTAAEGFILAYTWPILVSLLAVVLLGEKLTPRRGLAVLVSFLGVLVIVTQGRLVSIAFTSLTGDLLALAGAFVFALFSVLGKKAHYDQTVSATVYFGVALVAVAATLLLPSLAGEGPGVGWPSAAVWPWLLYNGFLVNGVSYIFWFKALENGDTFVISNALYLTPFLSLLFVFFWLDEPILPSAVIGLLVIVAGMAIQRYR
ncbi:MAG: DMT family transporter [Caldilineaceae bacterium]|nr:DMT family transporter [Caldilineaceae bacterium]HRJ40994.1 DMT family transporter [Caldilineaceae bacterium]